MYKSLGCRAAMNSFKNTLALPLTTKIRALDVWRRALENCSLRIECPDAYHDELLRLADEMDRQRIISWGEWRDLRLEADRAYLRAVTGEDYHRGKMVAEE